MSTSTDDKLKQELRDITTGFRNKHSKYPNTLFVSAESLYKIQRLDQFLPIYQYDMEEVDGQLEIVRKEIVGTEYGKYYGMSVVLNEEYLKDTNSMAVGLI